MSDCGRRFYNGAMRPAPGLKRASPMATPPGVVAKLNGAFNSILADPAMEQRLTSLGTSSFIGSPDDFVIFIADETGKWANVAKQPVQSLSERTSPLRHSRRFWHVRGMSG